MQASVPHFSFERSKDFSLSCNVPSSLIAPSDFSGVKSLCRAMEEISVIVNDYVVIMFCIATILLLSMYV